MKHRFFLIVHCIVALLAFCLSVSSAGAQGRPDMIWMRGRSTLSSDTLAWSPDGKILAEGKYQLIRLWKMPEHRLIRTINAVRYYYIRQITFSPDGQTLAVVGNENSDLSSLKTWRVSDGALLNAVIKSIYSNEFVSVSYSPDGQTMAVGEWYGYVRLWRASDLTLIRTLTDTVGEYALARFSPDGQTVAADGGNSTRTIKIWRVSDGALLRTIPEGGRGVIYSPNGQTLAATGGNNAINIWRVSDGALLRTIPEGGGGVVYSPDGQTLAASFGGTIKLWRTSDGSPLQSVAGGGPLAYSPDGTRLASGERGGPNIRDASTGEVLQHQDPAGYPVYSPNGEMLAVNYDGTVSLWRASDGRRLRTLPVTGIGSVAFSPDSQTLAIGSWQDTGYITLWRVSDGALLRTINLGPASDASALAFTPNGQTLASGSGDKTIKLFRVSDGALLRTLSGHTDVVTSLAITPDGQTLASGSYDKTIKLWSMSSGFVLRTLSGQTRPVISIALSPNGQTLASGSWDNTIVLWRVSDGASLRNITAGSWGYVTSVAFSPDGLVVACGRDALNDFEDPANPQQSLRFWRVSDGSLLQFYNQETGSRVDALAFSPDGRRLAYLRVDGILAVIKNPSGPPSSSVSGTIALDGLVTTAPLQWLDFTFRPANNGTPLTYTLPVGPDGAFSAPGLPNTSYTLHIKGSKWLAKNVAVNASNGDVSNVSALLLTGDANDDNTVDVLDLDALIQAFDTTNGGVADFNCDGSVDVLDLDLLIQNFDQRGDA